MLRQSTRSRFIIGSWYIGSGNKVSVFTRRSRRPFEKIREIYGDELERLKKERKCPVMGFHSLSRAEKLEIKSNIRSNARMERIKLVWAGIISLILTGLVVWVVLYVVGRNL